MVDCIFCKIISGKVPANKVYEDKNTLAFLDVNPMSLGHTLVVPKKHYETFDEVKEEYVKSLSLATQKVCKAISKISEGYNILQNNIIEQGVPHIHFHIVPRKKGDSLHFHQQTKKFSEQETKQIQERIKTLLK